MLVSALAATLIGFALLIVALISGTLWLAVACIVVCVGGGLLLLADTLGLTASSARFRAPVAVGARSVTRAARGARARAGAGITARTSRRTSNDESPAELTAPIAIITDTPVEPAPESDTADDPPDVESGAAGQADDPSGSTEAELVEFLPVPSEPASESAAETTAEIPRIDETVRTVDTPRLGRRRVKQRPRHRADDSAP